LSLGVKAVFASHKEEAIFLTGYLTLTVKYEILKKNKCGFNVVSLDPSGGCLYLNYNRSMFGN